MALDFGDLFDYTDSATDEYFNANSMGATTVTIKEDDTERESTTTATADPDLYIGAYEMYSAYLVDALILVDNAAFAGGLKIGLYGPTDATGMYSVEYLEGKSGTSDSVMPIKGNVVGTAESIDEDNLSTTNIIKIVGSVLLSSTTGAVGIAWSQNTADTSTLTVKTGSYIKLTRLN